MAILICTDKGDKSQIHFRPQTTLISIERLCCLTSTEASRPIRDGVSIAMEGVREGKTTAWYSRAQELCESGGGRPGLPSLISLRFLWT